MKKITYIILASIALLLSSPWSGYAGRTQVAVGANISVGNVGYRGYHGWGHHGRWRHPVRGPRFYWGGSVVIGPWYPYSYYAAPPVVVQQPPPVYVQPAPPVYVQPAQEQIEFWYYCQNPQGYYPYIKSCPGGWMKVVPEVTPPNQ